MNKKFRYLSKGISIAHDFTRERLFSFDKKTITAPLNLSLTGASKFRKKKVKLLSSSINRNAPESQDRLRDSREARGKTSRAFSFVGFLDLLFRDTAFASFRREPIGRLRGVLWDGRDAGPAGPDELPDASAQEQPEAQVDRLHGERRVARQCRRASEEEAQHPLRRGNGLLLSQGAGLHLRTFPGKFRKLVPPSSFFFNSRANVYVTSRYVFPLCQYPDCLATLATVSGSLNAAFKFHVFSFHCSGRV